MSLNRQVALVRRWPAHLAELVRQSADGARHEIELLGRERLHVAFRSARLLARQVYGQPPARTALIWPPIDSLERLGDVVNRASWHAAGAHLDIAVAVSPEVWSGRPDDLGQLPCPPHQQRYLDAPPPRLRLTPDGAGLLEMSDLVLLHDWRAVWSLTPRCLARAEMVDPDYFDITESSNWQEVHYLSLSPQQRGELLERSRLLFAGLAERFAGCEQAYVVGTGPSVDLLRGQALAPGSLRIGCNSLVKNDALMAHVAPHLMTFADPVFHFGVSSYAHELRGHLARAARQHEFLVMVPEHQAPLLLHHVPELRGRVIGMPVMPHATPHWPSRDQLWVNGNPNIMTLFMLPVATALANRVAIAGADGRAPNETYFWRHAESVQLGSLMPAAFATHPSFFRDRHYARYYRDHCRVLEEQLRAGKRRGVAYELLTPSHVPALAALRPELGPPS